MFQYHLCGPTFSHLSSSSSLSATNSMYCFISLQFIPMRLQGRASVRNSCSILTASQMISYILSLDGRFKRWLNIRQAKSQCNPYEKIMGMKISEYIAINHFQIKIGINLIYRIWLERQAVILWNWTKLISRFMLLGL